MHNDPDYYKSHGHVCQGNFDTLSAENEVECAGHCDNKEGCTEWSYVPTSKVCLVAKDDKGCCAGIGSSQNLKTCVGFGTASARTACAGETCIFASQDDGSVLAAHICALNYCNGESSLSTAECGTSGGCTTEAHALSCRLHWDEYGQYATGGSNPLDPAKCAVASSHRGECDNEFCEAIPALRNEQCFGGDSEEGSAGTSANGISLYFSLAISLYLFIYPFSHSSLTHQDSQRVATMNSVTQTRRSSSQSALLHRLSWIPAGTTTATPSRN